MSNKKNSRCLGVLLAAALPLCGCTYLQYASLHANYKRTQAEQPSQRIAKHSFDNATYFIYGQLLNDQWPDATQFSLAIAAVSSRYQRDEIVETNQLGRARSYYGMNLPGGDYRLLVFADVNHNGLFEANEIVGERSLTLSSRVPSASVTGNLNIEVTAPGTINAPDGFKSMTAATIRSEQASLFFPKGTIRTLDDPIFSSAMPTLGMYDPAAFIEAAPTMFYALEEDLSYKVPVVFVHGMGGSITDFRYLVEHLDRTHYKPWFFFYPSGGDLSQLAHLFYDIFLSGTVIPSNETPIVIIAHSMGGLVVREAMNLYEPGRTGNQVGLLITVATPFGGEPSASMGVQRAPFVPPAWRSLDPGGEFISKLFRHPLSDSTAHHLFYTYRNTQDVTRGTDGVVPLSSQLATAARNHATLLHGFKSGHTEILSNPAAVTQILGLIQTVHSGFPEQQMHYLLQGGFDVPLSAEYSDLEKYLLRNYGCFMRALAAGQLAPMLPLQQQFVSTARGEAVPTTPYETAWARFSADYPHIAAATAP